MLPRKQTAGLADALTATTSAALQVDAYKQRVAACRDQCERATVAASNARQVRAPGRQGCHLLHSVHTAHVAHEDAVGAAAGAGAAWPPPRLPRPPCACSTWRSARQYWSRHKTMTKLPARRCPRGSSRWQRCRPTCAAWRPPRVRPGTQPGQAGRKQAGGQELGCAWVLHDPRTPHATGAPSRAAPAVHHLCRPSCRPLCSRAAGQVWGAGRRGAAHSGAAGSGAGPLLAAAPAHRQLAEPDRWSLGGGGGRGNWPAAQRLDCAQRG